MQRERVGEKKNKFSHSVCIDSTHSSIKAGEKIKEKKGPFVSAFLELGPRLYLTESRRLF